MKLSRIIVLAAFLAFIGSGAGCGDGSGPEPPATTDTADPDPATANAERAEAAAVVAGPPAERPPRYDDFVRVRDRAVAWLDRLEIDLEALERHNIDGIKKLSELLWAYQILDRHTDDPAARAAYRERARHLAGLTNTLEYHALDSYDDQTFDANSQSYLLVASLLDHFKMRPRAYQQAIDSVKTRLDRSIMRRGERQRRGFADLYDRLGLEKTAVLLALPDQMGGLISRRLPADQISLIMGYDLAHAPFVAYDFGERRTQTLLTQEDIAYLKDVFPALIAECIQQNYPDLMAEVLSGMIYLGEGQHPAAQRALEWLLDHQNYNGTWGEYDLLRMKYGEYVDQQIYLHTVQVTLRALLDAFEGEWPDSPAWPAAGS
ncbi:MAG: hypothetical protein GY715_09215 [Planctomycetes bacterium]|nr:hypothetical protein [Planctomycetota bacterium]